jgi:catechol 2,3-dioxygenase-like lactoylglutathione lyase family enzyme
MKRLHLCSAVAVLTVFALAATSLAEQPAARVPVIAVESIGVTVRDLDAALTFYTSVLTFEKVSEEELTGEVHERLDGVFGLRKRVARIKLGDEYLDLTEYLTPRGRRIPETSRSNDGWFQHVAIIVRDMDEAYRHLRKHKIEHASPSPQRLPDWNKNAGGIRAFYFKDPDGHPLEILEFPPDKGDAKWHKPTANLFLGIDHTAIVVRDTDASLGYYRDRLGLKIVGESENYGPEQERLNNVFGARLRITALRAERGPGVELLEYLAPGAGKPMPRDSLLNDLWHWQIGFSAAEIAAVTDRRISAGPVSLSGGRAIIARDPDGHAVSFTVRAAGGVGR